MNIKKTGLGNIYDKTLAKVIPMRSFLSLIFCFIFNSLIYTGTQILLRDAKHHDLTTSADTAIPFMPGWSFIYLGCFLFWGMNYILIARQEKEEWFKFATGDYLSRIICGLFFVLLPTTNIRPEVVGDGVAQSIIRFVYWIDAPTNLFPSIHCLVSWMCFIGIRGKVYIPKWYRAFSCLFAIAVFASTLFTKQHFIVDVVAGVILAELCYYIGCHTKFHLKVMRCFEKINQKVFGGENEEQEESV